jgi:hypothetical protein
MPGEIVYVADEATARMTPDALRVALTQSGFPGRLDEGGETLRLRDDAIVLRLILEDNWVAEIEIEAKFADEAAVAFAHRLENWLETMGWMPLDDTE